MENKVKRASLFHRIKYRNAILPISRAKSISREKCRELEMNIRKRRQVIEYMDKMVKKRTIKVAPLHHFPLIDGDDNDIQKFCRNCPSTGMSRFLEKEILKKITARGLERHYPLLLKNMLAEAREEFLKITHKSGIAMKLKEEERCKIEAYKRLGRTKNYPIFLRARKQLETKFVLHRPLIRRILHECVTNLPYELLNLNQFVKSLMHADEFLRHLVDCANDAIQTLQEFYGKILILAEQNTDADSGNYLQACSGLLSVNISRTIAHTLLHAVTFTASKDHVPYLKLNITFNERLILEPSADEIIHIYNTSLAKIVNSAKQFYVLERHGYKGFNRKNLHLCLTDDFFDSVCLKISDNIQAKFEPILNYIYKLQEQFKDINIDTINNIQSDLIFDEGYKKIMFFKKYLPRVNFIPDNAYFEIGQLVLTEFRQCLREKLLSTIDHFFNNLCAQHEWENNDICEAFEIINVRATQKAITTEEVIEIGKYMAWIKSDYLSELKERVINSLAYLSKLIQLGELSVNHLKLNAKAINWLDEIQPILEENTSTYEQLKFEAEEKLQKVIEDVNVEIKHVYPLLDILDSMDDIDNVRNYLNDITLHMVKIREIEYRIDWINREEVSLSFPKSSYAEYEQLKNYVHPFYHLLKLCLNVKRNLSVWLDGPFDLINYERTKNTVENYLKELISTQKLYRNKLRQAQDENLSLRFKGTVDDPDMLNWPAPLKLCSKAIKLIQDFEPSLTVIKIMCNEALMKRHWKEMSKIAGFDITPNAGTTLRKIIQINLRPNMDNYELISIAATNEKKLLQDLQRMKEEWNFICFQTIQHNGLLIIHLIEDIHIIIDDHIIKIINMFNSIFVKPYYDQVTQFYHNLLKTQDILNQCDQLQEQITRNYQLFTCSTIITDLSNESKLFNDILKEYQLYVNDINKNPKVLQISASTNFLQDLQRFNNDCEIINRGVKEYFDRIRNYFPRFYFVTDTEMYRILSLTENPSEISSHLLKIFRFSRIKFNDDHEITSLIDANDSELKLNEMIRTKNFGGRVEMWLKCLEHAMKNTIRSSIKQTLQSYDLNVETINKLPLQILIIVSQIIFTSERDLNRIIGDIDKLVGFVKTQEIESSCRLKIQSMILSLSNCRSVLEDLMSLKSDCDFKWIAQLRYFNLDDIEVRILDLSIKYGYEYVGSFTPIVVTPSTERYYHTLIVALKFCFYASCQGAPETGKSEIFRNLASDLGIYFNDFYCTETLNLDILQNFIKGIECCQSWLCLEDFENIPSETISVLTQEIFQIAANRRCQSTNENYCFICFNMKPYHFAGLPENFKNLCRPITLLKPDIKIIIKITLISLGFQDLGIYKKIENIYQILSDIMPGNSFGLRNIKDALAFAQKTKNYNIIEAIRSVNVPKLSQADLKLFNQLISDDMCSYQIDKSKILMSDSIRLKIEQLNFEASKEIVEKAQQLSALIEMKTGVIICGKSMTGKSTLIKIIDNNTIREFINPKALNTAQLYGEFKNNTTKEWKDGVITKILRQNRHSLIILDGPLDPWADILNSVLDEKMTLCLPSGEVLHSTNTKFIFEVDNLRCASPAMICRCGVVYMEENLLRYEFVINSWISKCNMEWLNDYKDSLKNLFNWITSICLDFIKSEPLKLHLFSDLNLIQTALNLFEILMSDAYACVVKKEEDSKNFPSWIQASLILALTWSFNSCLNYDSLVKLDEVIKQSWKNPSNGVEKIEISLPQDGLIVDHIYIYKAKGSWKYWPDTLKNEKIDEIDRFTDLLIPTTESVKYSWLINMFIAHHKSFLLIGPRSTGKTLYFQDILVNKLDKMIYETSLIHFIRKIDAFALRNLMLSKLFKKKNGNYGPMQGKSAIFFIDDLHLSKKDKYDNSSSLELLREFFDYQYWYNETNNKVHLDDVNIVGALDSSYSNEELCQRFLRHFNVFSINTLPEDSVLRIYSNILFSKYKKIGFPSDVLGTINQIVGATFNFYNRIKEFFKPTPNRSFYQFHLRQISKIVQVFVLIKKESFDSNKKLFAKLWMHEINRVFGDRLDSDSMHRIDWFKNEIRSRIEDDFNEDFEQLVIMENCNESPDQFVFGTVCDIESGRIDGYDIEKLKVTSCNLLNDYNENNVNKFDLVLFDFALQHLSRICRILSLPNTHLLQIGICGSGRKTLVKLASLIYNQSFFCLEMSQNYDSINWRNNIKSILKEAGGFGKTCVLFLRDEQIIHEIILEDVEYLLKSGEIPCLYSLSEKQEILELVRESMQGGNANIEITIDNIFLNHHKKCRDNLHIFLAFSTENRNFRRYLQDYHSIIKYCEIDYYHEWPSESLETIAKFFINNLEISEDIKEDHISKMFSYIHKYIANVPFRNVIYITNGSYLEFVRLYYDLMKRKQDNTRSVKKKYLGALEKLSYAAVQIQEMQKSLANYQPQLEEMTIKAIEMAKQIEKETIEVEIASNLVKKDEKIANEQAAAAQILKLDCEADLAQAIPILEDAISALNTLKPTDITLVKSMKNPPDAIKLVMAAVCVIKDVKPDRIPDPSTGRKTLDYWGPSKRILGDMNFLQSLKDFDKDNIKPDIMLKIRKDYLPHKDFKPHVVAKASSAAEGLCKWIIAMDMYDKVAKEVAPKKEKLEKAEREYGNTMQILNEKKEQVRKIEQKLADLNALLSEATRKQQILQRNVDSCKNKLNRAQKLIAGLSEEKDRWTFAVDQLLQQYDNLPGDMLISSAIIAYLGPFYDNHRHEIIQHIFNTIKVLNKIPLDDSYNFLKNFQKQYDYDEWLLNSLPNDNFFTKNGIIAKCSKRWCLYIDPQRQASNWIQNIEKYNSIKIAKFHCLNHLNIIKDSIIFGNPVILENISDNISPILINIITKNTYFENNKELINFEGEVLNYNTNFFLYITCNLKLPQFSPEIYNRLTVVNFVLTKSALDYILLTHVVEIEKPNMKNIKKLLNKERRSGRETLQKIEEEILNTLNESTIDILEDESALQMLDDAKILSKDIQRKQEELRDQQVFLDNTKNDYACVAKHATILYFSVFDLSKINHMYQFSLEWYIELYTESIQVAHRYRNLEKRLQSLQKAITYELFKKICRSIFEKDKLYFSFLLSISLSKFYGKISHEEIKVLLTTETEQKSSSGKPTWLSDEIWDKMHILNRIEKYHDFLKQKISHLEYFIKSDHPEDEILPEPFNTNFDKLLLVNLLRPDRFIAVIIKFITYELGEEFVKPPFFDLSISFYQSNALAPLIFILKPDSDPINSLKNFAKTKYFENKLVLLSPKKGDEKMLEELIIKCQSEGSWICLQNCHLMLSWLSYLTIKLEEMDYNNTHENFRLWITTNETSKFPISLLEKSTKIVKEPRNELKQKVLEQFLNDPINSSEFFTSCPGNADLFTRLIYSLTIFHYVLKERQKFGVFGFNAPYEFKECDLILSLTQAQRIVNNNLQPITALYYLTSCCNYSVRANDKLDNELIMTVLADHLNTAIISNRSYLFNGNYGLPSKTDHQDYINYIRKFPDIQSPEICGLHPNYQAFRNVTEYRQFHKVFNNLLGDKQVVNDPALQSEIINDIIKKIPGSLDISMKFEKSDFVGNVILSEKCYFNKLVQKIRKDLKDLSLFINGHCFLTNHLEELYNSVAKNETPKTWSTINLSLTNFLEQLKKKYVFFDNYCDNTSKSVALSTFFKPKSFIIAKQLKYSNLAQIPFDNISIQVRFNHEESESKTESDILIDILYLIGASWNFEKNILDETLKERIIYTSLANVNFKLVGNCIKDSFYKCPLYRNPLERSYITSVLMESDKDVAFWIKRGVSLCIDNNCVFKL